MAADSSFDDLHMSTLALKLERTDSGGVLWITLNRPQAFNAVSMEMLSELHAVLDRLQHPPTMHAPLPPHFPRVVVIGAAGKAFSGGVDIKVRVASVTYLPTVEWPAHPSWLMCGCQNLQAADRGIGGRAWDYKDMRSQQLLARMIEKMRAIPQPIIAAVQGPTAGAGLAIALAADVRVAAPAASFSAAFVRLGLTGTDMGTSFFLPRIAGLGIAAEALLTGRPISAQRAYQVGLVNELVESPALLEPAARELAADMLQCSPRGLQLTKEQMNSVAEGGSLRAAMVAENSHQMLLVNDPATSAVAQAWLDSMLRKGGKQGGGGGARSKM